MIEIRDMQSRDAQAVSAVEKAEFTSPWSEESVISLSSCPYAVARVACDGENVVGYYSFYYTLDEGDVNNVAVVADRRREGIGRKLMDDMISQACTRGVKKLFLEVREDNYAARRLYEACGFENYSVRKKYYDNTTDAILYKRG